VLAENSAILFLKLFLIIFIAKKDLLAVETKRVMIRRNNLSIK